MPNRGISADAFALALRDVLGLPHSTEHIALDMPAHGIVTVTCRLIPDEAAMQALLAFLKTYHDDQTARDMRG